MNKITIQPGDTFTFNSWNASLCVYRRGESLYVVHSTGTVYGAVGGIRISNERDITRADALVLLRVYGVEVCEETPMRVVKLRFGIMNRHTRAVDVSFENVADATQMLNTVGVGGYELVRLDFGGAA